MASRFSVRVVSSAMVALAALIVTTSGQIAGYRVEICNEDLQNSTMGIGTTFGRCMLAPTDEYSHQRFTGCMNETDLCLQKNEFYAQCVPESRVQDGTKPRFADSTEIICAYDTPAPGPAELECKTEYEMCTVPEIDSGMHSCCDGLSCFKGNATEEEQYCLECPGWYAMTYEHCLGGDLKEEVECCDPVDECVKRDESYGSCRPSDESCCERVTFLLGNRGYRCPRNRDLDFVPGPCVTGSTEYEEWVAIIMQDPYTRI